LSPPEDIVSAELKRRKQEACFNFSKRDEKLFTELTELTRLGFEGWQRSICTGSTAKTR
jgi:hypothetical protein